MKAIFNKIGKPFAQALPALHSCTGNKYTFVLFQHTFGMIGEDFQFDMELFENVQNIVLFAVWQRSKMCEALLRKRKNARATAAPTNRR